MEAVAHNPKFAKKAGVPQSVGKDFAAADAGKSFAKKTTPTGRELEKRLSKKDKP